MAMVKLILKRILFLLGTIVALPFIIVTMVEAAIFGEDTEKILGWCKETLSLIPTIIGENIRLGYYWAVCRNVSPEVLFMFGCMVAHRNITIRSGSVIGSYSILGYADIGENVLLAARVSIISGKYQHGRPQDRISSASPKEQYEVISIGSNSWIGQDAIIMANIGENCTIAAGSVVYKDVPSNSTFMGNPARRVNLDSSLQSKEQK